MPKKCLNKCHATTSKGYPCKNTVACEIGCNIYCWLHAYKWAKGVSCVDKRDDLSTTIKSEHIPMVLSPKRSKLTLPRRKTKEQRDRDAAEYFAGFRMEPAVKNEYPKPQINLVDGLIVKQSTIHGAGFGVFTTKYFEKGDRVTKYTGKLLDEKQYESEGYKLSNEKSEYVIRYAKNWYLDGMYAPVGLGHMINHCAKRANVIFGVPFVRYDHNKVPLDKWSYIWVIATKTIRPGEELLTDYGDEYNFQWDTSKQGC